MYYIFQYEKNKHFIVTIYNLQKHYFHAHAFHKMFVCLTIIKTNGNHPNMIKQLHF